MGLGQAGENLKLALPAGPGLCGTPPYPAGLLRFRKACERAGTARLAQVTAGRAGHPGPGQAGVQLPAERGLPWWGALRAWQEGRGCPCPSPLLDTASSFTSPFPVQIRGPWCVARGRPQRRLGQQTRDCSGQAQPGGRGLGRQLSGALAEEPGHLILTHCALCQPPV